MTTRELDRLVSRTSLTPTSKQVLREVRHAVISGRAADPAIGESSWSVGIVSRGGSTGFRYTFSFKKADR